MDDSTMDDSTKKEFVDLYNNAVLKILPTGTMNATFDVGQTTDEEGNNKNNTKKEVFLEFMKKNFPDINGTGVDNVKKFIEWKKLITLHEKSPSERSVIFVD